MVDILARMRDTADAQNLAPVLALLCNEGFACTLACDEDGKAYMVIEKEFPTLIAHARRYPDADALRAVHHAPRVYFSSMQEEGIGRTPLFTYRSEGAWTAVVQETPGWRLAGWDAYPDALFGMPGTEGIVRQRWQGFAGEVQEVGMPAYDSAVAHAQRSNRSTLREALGVSTNEYLLHLAVPAHYAAAFLSAAEGACGAALPLRLLVRLHPKASAEDCAVHKDFMRRHAPLVVRGGTTLSPLDAILASDCTAATITSTMLVQAALMKTAPIAYAGEAGLRELAELGGFPCTEEFPYTARGHFALARTQEEWCTALTRIFFARTSLLAPFPPQVQSSAEAIAAIVRKKISHR